MKKKSKVTKASIKLKHDLIFLDEERKSNSRFQDKRFDHMKCCDIIRWHDFNNFPMSLTKYYQKRIPNMMMLISSRKPNGLAMAKYIILVYDKASPFVAEHRILSDRKKAVLSFVALNEKNTKPQADACLNLSDELVVDALNDYLKWQDEYTWSMIVQNEEVFYNNQKQILQGVSGSEKDTDRLRASDYQSKLLDSNEKISKRIKALWAEFTGGDQEAEAMIKERKPLSPEMIAEYEIDGFEYKFDEEE